MQLQTSYQAILVITGIGILICLSLGFNMIRTGRRIPYFRSRQQRVGSGWRMIGLAGILTIFAFVITRFGGSLVPPVATPAAGISQTPMIFATGSATYTPSATATDPLPTIGVGQGSTLSPSGVPGAAITVSATISVTATISSTPTITRTPYPSLTPTIANTHAPTLAPSETLTAYPTWTQAPTATLFIATHAPTLTPTLTFTPTPTRTPLNTSTNKPSSTPAATVTP